MILNQIIQRKGEKKAVPKVNLTAKYFKEPQKT